MSNTVPSSRVEQPTSRRESNAASLSTSHHLTFVPDVVGLHVRMAVRILEDAGYTPSIEYLESTNAAVPLGHITASVPKAGTLASGGKVKISLPRAALITGMAALSLDDARRHMGFNVDEGRYAEVLGGADMIFREYFGQGGALIDGWYLEPSDGARFFASDEEIGLSAGIGNYTIYASCSNRARMKQVTEIRVSGDAHFCLVTSEGAVAVVQARLSDRIKGKDSREKSASLPFHYAVFPISPAKALGKTRSSEPSVSPMPICESARIARARSSPSAAGLEARCRASGGQNTP
jgi:hypothetical protein